MTLEQGGKELFFIVMVGDITSILLGEDFIRRIECNFDFSSHEFVIQLGGKFINRIGFISCKSL